MNFYTIYSDYTFPFPQLLPDLLHLPTFPNIYPLFFSLIRKQADI